MCIHACMVVNICFLLIFEEKCLKLEEGSAGDWFADLGHSNGFGTTDANGIREGASKIISCVGVPWTGPDVSYSVKH